MTSPPAPRAARPPSTTSRDLIIAIMVGTLAGAGLVFFGDPQTDDVLPAIPLAVLAVASVALATLAMNRRRVATQRALELEQLVQTDTLTGLPSRHALPRLFDELLRSARGLDGRIAVLSVDIGGLDELNIAQGHDAGDRALQKIAARLERNVGESNTVVRQGGHVFVVLRRDITNVRAVERDAARVIKALSEPVDLDEEPVRLRIAVGIALSEERCTRPDEVLHDANAARVMACAMGPGRIALFDRGVADQVTPSSAEQRLRQALADGEFRLYFQPVVSLWTKRLVGVEALLRWNDARLGMVPPEDFLPALEDTGLIVPIGRWILEEVCRQAHQWSTDFPDRPPLNIKVNIAGRQMTQVDFIDHLRDTIAATGVAPSQLTLETDETTLMNDVEGTSEALTQAKALGVSIALDNFGVGHSSLSHLSSLGLDLLAIDRSFVDGVVHSSEDRIIVEHVIAMAKALGVVTVAEGVESEAQVEQLRAINCDLAQGYYFSHPQPPGIITELLSGNSSHLGWEPDARAVGGVEAPQPRRAQPTPPENPADVDNRFTAR
jgi:diguanylate cyclase (GGDEF)-like protein